MKTYSFAFVNRGEEDEIEFCAHTPEEAIKLYRDWCIDDEGLQYVPDFKIRQVYNSDDAREYGAEYEAP